MKDLAARDRSQCHKHSMMSGNNPQGFEGEDLTGKTPTLLEELIVVLTVLDIKVLSKILSQKILPRADGLNEAVVF